MLPSTQCQAYFTKTMQDLPLHILQKHGPNCSAKHEWDNILCFKLLQTLKKRSCKAVEKMLFLFYFLFSAGFKFKIINVRS